MVVGCNTFSLRGLPRSEAFAQLRALEFTAAELWAGHANYQSIGISARQVAAEAARSGIALRVYCVGGLFGLRPRVVEDRLARAFDFARKLDVGLVTGVLDRAAVRLADARAQRQGVRFALENHWYTEVARPRDVLAALDDCSPAVGAAIDTGHFAFLGCDLAAAARLLGRRTLHVHLKVVRRPSAAGRLLRRYRKRHHMEPSLPGPRDGLEAFAAALRAAGYAGMLAVEHEGTDDLPAALDRYRRRAEMLARDGTVPAPPEAVRA
jgi:sugar phosphate isomerase/epimerase